jgi:hypothetical protein
MFQHAHDSRGSSRERRMVDLNAAIDEASLTRYERVSG